MFGRIPALEYTYLFYLFSPSIQPFPGPWWSDSFRGNGEGKKMDRKGGKRERKKEK